MGSGGVAMQFYEIIWMRDGEEVLSLLKTCHQRSRCHRRRREGFCQAYQASRAMLS